MFQGQDVSLSASRESEYSYLVKILNPEQKSKFVTKIWHNMHDRFDSPNSLKEKLVATFKDKLPQLTSLDIGYFERRGSAKRWIEDQAMYRAFSVGEEITLWVHGCRPEDAHVPRSGKKRKRDVSEDTCSSRKQDREARIDSVVQELREIHKDKYSGPQLRLWARLKVNGQHDSMDSPPNIPLFSGVTHNRSANSLNEALTSAATAVVSMLKGTHDPARMGSNNMSPSKRAHVSRAYLDHLDKLKRLLESGVLSQEEFEEQKGFVLKNIRSLNY